MRDAQVNPPHLLPLPAPRAQCVATAGAERSRLPFVPSSAFARQCSWHRAPPPRLLFGRHDAPDQSANKGGAGDKRMEKEKRNSHQGRRFEGLLGAVGPEEERRRGVTDSRAPSPCLPAPERTLPTHSAHRACAPATRHGNSPLCFCFSEVLKRGRVWSRPTDPPPFLKLLPQ